MVALINSKYEIVTKVIHAVKTMNMSCIMYGTSFFCHLDMEQFVKT